MRTKFCKNAHFFDTPASPYVQTIVPSNILSVEVLPNNYIEIIKLINFPGEPFTKRYILEKPSHIYIARKVLSGQLSAQDGNDELCKIEGLSDKWDSDRLALGSLLQSLFLQSSPDNKKIRYIDSDVEHFLEEIEQTINESQGMKI